MRILTSTVCGAVLLAAGAAQAQERPLLLPARDAAITYHISSDARGAPDEARVAFKAGGQKLRVEANNQPGYVIVDRAGKRALLVMSQGHLAVEVGLGDTIDRYLMDPQAKFRRLGEDRVAGQPCTNWEMHSPQANGQGCVTADGLILRASGTDRRGEHASLEAREISYAPQPDAAFALPADTRPLSLSNLSGLLRAPR